jgi:thiol-disulfide isomerase/thioredoxin
MTITKLDGRVRRAVAIALALVPVGLALAATSVRAQDGGIAIGAHVPAAMVRTLDGKAIQLSTVVGQGPALIEFWATWCPNCKELEPALAAAQKKYSERVRFVTVAVAINESFERVQKHVAAHDTPGTVVYDADGNAASAYDAPATSYVVVVDRTGRVVYTGVGGTQDLDAAIRKAL